MKSEDQESVVLQDMLFGEHGAICTDLQHFLTQLNLSN
jgi:hypothetical protein